MKVNILYRRKLDFGIPLIELKEPWPGKTEEKLQNHGTCQCLTRLATFCPTNERMEEGLILVTIKNLILFCQRFFGKLLPDG